MKTNPMNTPNITIAPSSTEAQTITSSTCRLHQDDAFEAILPPLGAEGIKVISHDDHLVECPGQALHTTPTVASDCKVFVNDVNGNLVPCLHCFHRSCRDMILECNHRLCRAALAGKSRVYHNAQPKTVTGIHNSGHIVRPNSPTVKEILAKYPWSYQDIINDERGKVEEPPEFHYFHILSMLDANDRMWIGRDVYDTGSINHHWRFLPVAEWWKRDKCPGAYTCPSTFRPDVFSRSDENVLRRKFLVVESDELDRDQVGAVFRWMESHGHRLRAIVDTAGKSLHGWFDFPDESCIPTLKEHLIALKCDPNMFRPSQPCRLPGALRDGKYQKLIYFNNENPHMEPNKTNQAETTNMNTTNTNTMHNTTPPAAPESSPQTNCDTIRKAVHEAVRAASPKPKPKAKPKAGPKVTPGVTAPILPNLFYDHHMDRYWMKMPNGHWIKLNNRFIWPHLFDTALFNSLSEDEQKCFSTDVQLSIQRYAAVNFAGALAGYKEGLVIQGDTRILVTSSPKFIAPVPGNWDMLRGILEKMFGDVQLPYVYGWIKKALEMFAAQTWMAGQVLVLCGPVESGKNLFGFLLEKLFGGRAPGKPYDYMTQRTSFNSEFMGCELLTIEDEVSHTDIQARRAFGAMIKDIAVNTSRRLHRKHAEALTVVPLQRLLISLNNDSERLLVIPPVESDIEDKLMLLKVDKHPMPMPTQTAKAKAAFSDALLAQLPAFVDFLQNWQIPACLVSDRFGIKYYHHPDILDGLHELSPEEKLLQLIDEVLFSLFMTKNDWSGKAVDLDRKLKNSHSKDVQREAEKLLPSVATCGKYLGRLANRHPDRVTMHPGHAGTRRWTITPPSTWGDKSELSPGLIAKIREVTNKGESPQAATPEDDKQSPAPAVDYPQPEVKIKSVRIKGEPSQDSQAEDVNNQDSPPPTVAEPIAASISSGAKPQGVLDLRSRVRMAEFRLEADRELEIRYPSLN